MKDSKDYHPYAQALDVHNALVHLRDTSEWKAIKEREVRPFTWQPDDPLADVLLVQLGGYPSADEMGTGYRAPLLRASEDIDSPFGEVCVNVRLDRETVWLTQEQMSQLFGRERSVTTKHVRNVFRDGSWNLGQQVQNLHRLKPRGTEPSPGM